MKNKICFHIKGFLFTGNWFAIHWILVRYSLDIGSLLTGYRVLTHWISGPYSLDIGSLLTGYRALTAIFSEFFYEKLGDYENSTRIRKKICKYCEKLLISHYITTI